MALWTSVLWRRNLCSMPKRNRHRRGFAPPYYLRANTLIVMDGARRSGKTTQLERLCHAGPGVRLFATTPHAVDIAVAPTTARRDLVGRAMEVLGAGGTVLAERWDYSVRTPDVVLLFPNSVEGSEGKWTWPPVDANLIVPMPKGHEGLVGGALWTALAARRFFSPCPCITDAA